VSDFGYTDAVLLTDEVGEPHWRLGTFPSGDGLGVMVGWTVENPEGGVPTSVAHALVRAMARYGRITFARSIEPLGEGDSWRMNGEDALARRAILSQGAWRRLLFGGASTVPLLSTRHEDAALELFGDPYFQWWNASQFALVSRPPEVPPPLGSPLPSELFEDNWAEAIGPLRAAGVEIVMRSGVDGDVCGLAFGSREIRNDFESVLEAAAAEFGLVVIAVSCADFGQILSDAANLSG